MAAERERLHTAAVGLSWRTAPAELRDRCHVPAEAVPMVLASLRERGACEALLISTCNRVEFWLAGEDPEAAAEAALGLWQSLCAPPEGWRGSVYVHLHEEAVSHAFRVGASIDSLVLGETQIHSQVRSAWETARAAGHAGFFLGRLVQGVLAAAGEVRSRTRLAEGTVSISSAAVDLARKIAGPLERLHIGVVGAGEMAELAVTGFVRAGAKRITYVNRTAANARRLVNIHPGAIEPLEALPALLGGFDVVVSATGAPGFVVTASDVVRAMDGRRRPLFLLDIAAPRDVEPACGKVPGVFLYGIDDLEQVVDRNRLLRGREAVEAERLLAEACDRFREWYRSLSVVPLLVEVRERVHAQARAEVERFLPRVRQAGEEDRLRAVLEDFAQALANKVLHGPTAGARQAAAEGREHEVAAALRDLFLRGDLR